MGGLSEVTGMSMFSMNGRAGSVIGVQPMAIPGSES